MMEPVSSGTFPGTNGKIIFASDRDGNKEIYVMDADGSNQTRLTTNSSLDVEPSWSPNGSKIAFNSDRDGNKEIYVMNADGSNATRLTNNDSLDADLSWSPDGSKIVFNSNRGDNSKEIYVMDADGSNQTRLTNNSAADFPPNWGAAPAPTPTPTPTPVLPTATPVPPTATPVPPTVTPEPVVIGTNLSSRKPVQPVTTALSGDIVEGPISKLPMRINGEEEDSSGGRSKPAPPPVANTPVPAAATAVPQVAPTPTAIRAAKLLPKTEDRKIESPKAAPELDSYPSEGQGRKVLGIIGIILSPLLLVAHLHAMRTKTRAK